MVKIKAVENEANYWKVGRRGKCDSLIYPTIPVLVYINYIFMKFY
jgi:hypothetical protein